MNRFEALDIDDFEPDQVEQDRELQENIAAARAAGLGPELEDLEKLRALQRSGGSEFAKKIYDYDDPKVKAELDKLFATTQMLELVKNMPKGRVVDRNAVMQALQETGGSVLAREAAKILDERNWGETRARPAQHPVQWLQRLLNTKTKRAKLIVDGILGPHTLAMAVQKKIWNTQDGRTIAIKDMSDAHLLNATRMLMRGERADRDVMLRVLEYEANRRGRLL